MNSVADWQCLQPMLKALIIDLVANTNLTLVHPLQISLGCGNDGYAKTLTFAQSTVNLQSTTPATTANDVVNAGSSLSCAF